jgi:hypothetical protein
MEENIWKLLFHLINRRRFSVKEDLKENIIKEAKRIEEDCLYSGKGHFIAANFWNKFHLWIGIPTAALAAIASATALSQFDNHNVISGILAILVAVLTAIATFLNPNGRANMHLSSGNKYLAVRNIARIFYEVDIHAAESDRELTKNLKKMAKKRDELNQDSPQIPPWAYKKAKKGIERGEAEYKIE